MTWIRLRIYTEDYIHLLYDISVRIRIQFLEQRDFSNSRYRAAKFHFFLFNRANAIEPTCHPMSMIFGFSSTQRNVPGGLWLCTQLHMLITFLHEMDIKMMNKTSSRIYLYFTSCKNIKKILNQLTLRRREYKQWSRKKNQGHRVT